jgi:tetratricopeptide (TPR) repeat protein
LLATLQHPIGAATPQEWAAAQAEAGRLLDAGSYDAAFKKAQLAVSLAQSAFGNGSTNEALSLNVQGETLRRQEQLTPAQHIFEQALSMCDAVGPYEPESVPILNNLARCYRLQGKSAIAESLFRRSIFIAEQVHDDLAVNRAQSGLAQVFTGLGEYRKSERLLLKARDFHLSRKPVDNRALSVATADLGVVAEKQGRFNDACDLYAKACELDSSSGGRFADGLASNYARALMKCGKVDHAIKLLRQVVQRGEALTPTIHFGAVKQLATALQEQGDYAEAEPLYETAIKLAREHWGAGEQYCTALNDLAAMYASQEVHTKAVPLYEQAVAIQQAASQDPGETLVCNLASSYEAVGAKEKAKRLRQRYPQPIEQSVEADSWTEWSRAATAAAPFHSSGQRWKYPQEAQAAGERFGDLALMLSGWSARKIDPAIGDLFVDYADWYRRKAKVCADLAEIWQQSERAMASSSEVMTAVLTAIDVVRSAYTGSDPLATVNAARDLDSGLRDRIRGIIEDSRKLDTAGLDLVHRREKLRVALSRDYEGGFPAIP